MPVHPHACGEHFRYATEEEARSGSSPRMWGTLELGMFVEKKQRFIPTHVGNTAARPGAICPCPVHPHACGEHLFRRSIISYPGGSSPRMWGTHASTGALLRLTRFIPTHVGNTSARPLARPLAPVHPHACGEHSANQLSSESNAGSSPRMWGTRCNNYRCIVRSRFIPTHVGNTM